MKTTSVKNKSPVKQSWIEGVVLGADRFQRKHYALHLPIGIIKKYDEDGGGHLAALLTYYGFLSLFPMFIVATAVAQIFAHNNDELKSQILHAVTSYFPAIGDTLSSTLFSTSKNGITLAIALLIALYGVRGFAEVVQHVLHIVWAVPRPQRKGFPVSFIRSLSIVFFGGIGLIVSAILTGYATTSNFAFLVRILLGTMGFLVLYAVFWGVFTYGSSARPRRIANVPGALIAATGLLFLQAIGSYLIAYQLGRYTGLSVQFGVVLALLFWIYLQAVMFIFALEYSTVRAYRLYPRTLDEKRPTSADKHAHQLYAKRDAYAPNTSPLV